MGRAVGTLVTTAIVTCALVAGATLYAGETGPPRSRVYAPAPAIETSADSTTWWERKLDRIVRGRPISVAIANDGDLLYTHRADKARVPASNQKLLLSMAAFDHMGPNALIGTSVAARRISADGVVFGNLWIHGHGDPAVSGLGYGSFLPFRPTRLGELARYIDDTGIRRIKGRVMGSTGYFGRDWFAPGWKPEFPSRYVALPSALTFNGNVWNGRHIDDPERRAAHALTRRLRDRGIKVGRRASSGRPPDGLELIAQMVSAPLRRLIDHTNTTSSNFFAEVLGKALAADVNGPPGTIAGGARVVRRWAAGRGVDLVAHDASGLSYENRISARGLVTLLASAETESWARDLKASLPRGGAGTLEHRLEGVRIRAKTGTLESISALSGYLWLRRAKTWGEFAILSRGMTKSTAAGLEDRIVRVAARGAR